MARPLAVTPDDEAALLAYLRGVTQLTDLLADAGRINLQLPAATGPHVPTALFDSPWLLVQRIAGQAPDVPGLDAPVVQVDALGGTRAACKQVMLTGRAAILAIANDATPGGVLIAAEEEIGPSWLPDTINSPPTPRYVARYRLLTHR